jgi:hypothetical protein
MDAAGRSAGSLLGRRFPKRGSKGIFPRTIKGDVEEEWMETGKQKHVARRGSVLWSGAPARAPRVILRPESWGTMPPSAWGNQSTNSVVLKRRKSGMRRWIHRLGTTGRNGGCRACHRPRTLVLQKSGKTRLADRLTLRRCLRFKKSLAFFEADGTGNETGNMKPDLKLPKQKTDRR